MPPRRNLYAEVTQRVIDALGDGQIPWRKPWKDTLPAGDGRPRNGISGRPYRGINMLLLSLSEYADPRWVTFNQAKQAGGQVRKGEKSTMVVFFRMLDIKEQVGDEEPRTVTVPVMRSFNVFNVEQVDGLALQLPEGEDFRPDEECERMLSRIEAAPVIRSSSKACYIPEWDEIHIPPPSAFHHPDGYYHTLFHELAHATGHPTRLDRKGFDTFGSDHYAREELTAEIASMMVGRVCGIDPMWPDNPVAYIKSWVDQLKDDENERMIVHAAARAQRAADWIIGDHETDTLDVREGSQDEQAADSQADSAVAS